jgi:DNA-directed RNA polymerase specialized sigma subunit
LYRHDQEPFHREDPPYILDEEATRIEEQEAIARLFASLGDKDKLILSMRLRMPPIPVRRIAAILQLSERSVQRRLQAIHQEAAKSRRVKCRD